jgi:hypothetical protein
MEAMTDSKAPPLKDKQRPRRLVGTIAMWVVICVLVVVGIGNVLWLDLL